MPLQSQVRHLLDDLINDQFGILVFFFQMLDSKLNLIFHFGILIFEPQMTTLQGHERALHPGRFDPARRVAGADEVARLRDGRRHAGPRGRRHRGGRLHRQGRTFTCDIRKL